MPDEMMNNWDQTRASLVPVGQWATEMSSAKQVDVVGSADKTEITVMVSMTLYRDLPPPQVIYLRKTDKCQPKCGFPVYWDDFHSPNHWSGKE